jgi:hypothetical protein
METTTVRDRQLPILKRATVLTAAHWWITLAGLALVVWVVGLAAMPLWWVDARGRELQRCLGFAASTVTMAAGTAMQTEAFVITSINTNSPLARVGLKPGDTPVDYQHASDGGLYRDLDAALNGRDVTVHVVATADWSRGRNALRSIHLVNLSGLCK